MCTNSNGYTTLQPGRIRDRRFSPYNSAHDSTACVVLGHYKWSVLKRQRRQRQQSLDHRTTAALAPAMVRSNDGAP